MNEKNRRTKKKTDEQNKSRTKKTVEHKNTVKTIYARKKQRNGKHR